MIWHQIFWGSKYGTVLCVNIFKFIAFWVIWYNVYDSRVANHILTEYFCQEPGREFTCINIHKIACHWFMGNEKKHKTLERQRILWLIAYKAGASHLCLLPLTSSPKKQYWVSQVKITHALHLYSIYRNSLENSNILEDFWNIHSLFQKGAYYLHTYRILITIETHTPISLSCRQMPPNLPNVFVK